MVFLGCSIHAAGESQLGDIQLVLQEFIDDLNHALNGHGLFRYDQTALRVSGGKLGLERGALHLVGGGAILDTLLFVDLQDCRQQRIIFPQDQGMVEILQNLPCRLLNFVAGEDHIHARFNSVLDFDGQNAGMSMQILGLSFETIKTVCVLQV